MTTLLERAMAKAKSLPQQRQDEVGQMLLEIVEHDNSELRLSSQQQAEVKRRLTSKIEFVPDGEMKALFTKLSR
jgi:hypothetical protein